MFYLSWFNSNSLDWPKWKNFFFFITYISVHFLEMHMQLHKVNLGHFLHTRVSAVSMRKLQLPAP